MRIVVLDGHPLNPGDLSWEALAGHGELICHPRTAPQEVAARCAGADVLITNKVPFDAARMASLPSLKLIAVTATGYNIIDTRAARERGVTVCNVRPTQPIQWPSTFLP